MDVNYVNYQKRNLLFKKGLNPLELVLFFFLKINVIKDGE